MEHTQLELDFAGTGAAGAPSGGVVDFQSYAALREARRKDAEKAALVAEIVKSVQHITGRSPDAEMM